MNDARRNIPAPTPDPETAPFWEAAQQEVFLLPRCNDCQAYYWYPRTICPHCMGTNTDWVQSRGRGRIYSLTVMRKASVPYCVAYVELDEGPRILTNIQTDDLDSLAIGQRVEVVYVPSGQPQSQNIPLFRQIVS